MSCFWNERTKNITPYIPGEQPKDKQFIKLNTNENPYPPSVKVIEAIKNAADENLRLYPDPECTQLREAIASRYGVKKEQVFAGNGSDEILGFAFGAFFESNTVCCSGCCATKCADCDGSIRPAPILFPDITYSFYLVYAGLWNIPYKTIPLCDDFTINTSDYKVKSGGVIIPNPNAPTAIETPLDDILSIAEYLEKQNKVLILDEAYIAFGAKSAISYINKYKNLLVVHTLSKDASLAGLRAGFAIGDEKLIEALCCIRDSFNSYTLDRLALAGAQAAIEDAAYYNEINTRVIKTRERVIKDLQSLNCHVMPSSANFIFVKGSGISGMEFFTKLREKGILVRHFNKDRIKDFLRISIGTDEEMDKFIEACKVILKRG